ncbi:MAG TPA: hypothetical protein VFI11_06335 [Anaerolineales bacterium]|nr:hypothetical protein [Anaerolineales bacterium]
MKTDTSPRPRPYWHVDAKWITGLLLSLVLALTLLTFALVRVTAERPAVDALTMLLAVSFSQNGLDDETEIAEMRRMLEADADGEIQPMPDLAITVRVADLAERTPREIRLAFFRKMAEPLYGGEAAINELAADSETREAMARGGVLSVLSSKTHELLQRALTVLGILSAVLALALIYFSYRFGRLASPGCVLFVAALPGAALFGFLGWAFNPPGPSAGPDSDMTGMLSSLASNVLPPLAQIAAWVFLAAMALGILLIFLSIVGGLVSRRRRASAPAGSAASNTT